MPESDDHLRLEIGHVLFIDIVGYSKLLIEEQKERLNQVTEILRARARCAKKPCCVTRGVESADPQVNFPSL